MSKYASHGTFTGSLFLLCFLAPTGTLLVWLSPLSTQARQRETRTDAPEEGAPSGSKGLASRKYCRTSIWYLVFHQEWLFAIGTLYFVPRRGVNKGLMNQYLFRQTSLLYLDGSRFA